MIAGIEQYDYLVCDGGPHLVLPKSLSASWSGASLFGWIWLTFCAVILRLQPKRLLGDYGRAYSATVGKRIALLRVGCGEAIALEDPPMSAWGFSPEGWIDIYSLQDWSTLDLDRMIRRAVDGHPTESMTDTGLKLRLAEPDLILMFAGSEPGHCPYGEYEIPLARGNYRILEGIHDLGSFENNDKDTLYIYRLKPIA